MIEISLTNANSRAARPVGSSAAANNVDHYKLVVLKDGAVAEGVTVTQIDGAAVSSNDSMDESGAAWNSAVSTEGAGEASRENGLKKIKLAGLKARGVHDYFLCL